MAGQPDEPSADTSYLDKTVSTCLKELDERGIYFNSSMRLWRRVKPSTCDGVVRVSTITRFVVVDSLSDKLVSLETLEEACERAPPSVYELLDVKDDGTACHLQPLTAWRFAYYPASRVWRFTRSHRDEVAATKVAKRLGVSVGMIRRWEEARLRTSG